MNPLPSVDLRDREQDQHFAEHGYAVLKGLCNGQQRADVLAAVTNDLDPLVEPVELEADVGYPGSPKDRLAAGGRTPRRLLQAYARDPIFQQLAMHPRVAARLEALVGGAVMLSQCYHNCVMTKHPGFSSATLWHQDIRYWSFARPELISVWHALGAEAEENGALRVIPGTHKQEFAPHRMDAASFLKPELAENKALIERAIIVELEPGDALLFHCRLLHAAGQNHTDQVKLSPVFTYHRDDNLPLRESRSDRFPSISLLSSSVQ